MPMICLMPSTALGSRNSCEQGPQPWPAKLLALTAGAVLGGGDRLSYSKAWTSAGSCGSMEHGSHPCPQARERLLQEMSELGPGLRAQRWEGFLIAPCQASPVALHLVKIQMKNEGSSDSDDLNWT